MLRKALRSIAFCILLAAMQGCVTASRVQNEIFQVSTINALLEGAYEGTQTVAELKASGDFGIGAFGDLDGELFFNKGLMYQIRSDGKIYFPDDSKNVSLATVTFFKPEKTVKIEGVLTLEELKGRLDLLRASDNAFYAIRVAAAFERVKTRSVPRQHKPYPRLSEVTKDQPVFEGKDTSGVLVGFWSPEFMQTIAVPGYHLHFVSDNRLIGGHLLDCVLSSAVIEVSEVRSLQIVLPQTQGFDRSELSSDKSRELERVEK